MNRQKLVMQVRSAIAQAVPEAQVKRWFCRICALAYLEQNGLIPDGRCIPAGSMPLFAEAPEHLPQALWPALELLRRIPPEDWHAAPELTGWLYQYYNIPEREAVFADLRRNVKIPPEQIPAATQLFTPDWIVQYMAQNALGTVCRPLPSWRYFLPPEGERPLPERAPEELRILDPCMGTGHILAYVFDALMELYLAQGTTPEAAARRILTRNLCGLDIDGEAVLLCDFVLRMKAAPYLPDILREELRPQLCGTGELALPGAETFGSLLRPEHVESRAAALLQGGFDVVITNPPYMGSSNMSRELSLFMKQHYPRSRADLYAAFMERCAELTAQDGCFSMLTMHGWMFLSSFRELRRFMRRHTMQSMVHLGPRAFPASDVGTIVQTTAFTALGREYPALRAAYVRLTEAEDKAQAFFDPALHYRCTAERFTAIPQEPVCYWISDRMREVMQGRKLSDICRICQGMTTSDNKRFVRRWYEVPPEEIAFGCKHAQEAAATGKTWFPYNKGGRLRRWYGNHSFVVNFRNNGEALRAFHAELNKTSSGGRLKNADCYFRPAVTWPFITESTKFGVRYQPEGFLFDVSGSCLFPAEEDTLYLMGLLSSTVVLEMLKLCNPTMNFQVENLSSLPVIFDRSRQPEVEQLVRRCIALAQEDWDSREESWAFTAHPLVQTGERSLSGAMAAYLARCRERIAEMQRHEERLNRIFAEIYGLTEELDCAAPETTLCLPDEKAAAESLISYAVGCLFGRYQQDGVEPLPENFLPLAELPERIQMFLAAVFGTAHLAEELACLEAALGDSLPHYCMTGFYSAHCRRFHRRPLCWLAASGRRHAVHGLCYVHRMGESPVPLLRRITEALPPSPERDGYLEKLSALADARLDPDAGITENHAKFRPLFAAIR